jgi:hypothetical protein
MWTVENLPFGFISSRDEYRGPISSGHGPIRAGLERMVIIEVLLMEVASIVIQHPLNSLYPVVKNELSFRPLNFTQKFLNASEKILCPGELLSCQCRLHVPENLEVRKFQARIAFSREP